jgi:energy-coupling factor transporter ATP-binding protein EcfA2
MAKTPFERVRVSSRRDITAALEEADFEIPLFDVTTMPRQDKEAELQEAGIATHVPAEQYGAATAFFAARACTQEDPPPLVRPEAVDKLSRQMAVERVVVLGGALGSGKSTVARQVAEKLENRGEAVIFIDGFSLRMTSQSRLSREVLSLISERFALSVDHDPELVEGGFLAYVRHRVKAGTIIVFDHADQLADRTEPLQWLSDLADAVQEAHMRLLIVARGVDTGDPKSDGRYRTPAAKIRRKVRGSYFQLGELSRAELSHWINAPFFASHRTAGLDVDKLQNVIGGRPRLAVEFGAFLANSASSGDTALEAFRAWAEATYSPECAQLIDVLRRFPDWLLKPLSAPPYFRQLIIDTGAVVEGEQNELAFAAPVIAKRFRRLSTPANLLRLTGTSMEAVVATTRMMELVGAPFCAYCQTRAPREVLIAVVQMLERLGLSEVTVSLADRINSRLWSKVYPYDSGDSEAVRLDEEQRPDFAIVARNGHPRITTTGRLLLPIFGDIGRVAVVAEGRLPKEDDSLMRMTRVRKLKAFAQQIQPVVSLAVEQDAYKHHVRLQRARYYRAFAVSNAAQDARSSMLLNAAQVMNCSAVAVMQRGMSNWIVSTLQATTSHSGDQWEELLSGGSIDALNGIAFHPSRRGLVLSGVELLQAFPRLRNLKGELAVFMQPVWQKELCRLVVFVFEGPASRGIFGLKQAELSNTALLATA